MEHTAAQVFGQILKKVRVTTTPDNGRKKIRVQDICEQLSCARSLWYRWESGQETPMKEDVLKRIVEFFEIKLYSPQWFKLTNYAYIAHNSIPPYVRTDPSLLHTVFIHLHDVKPTRKEFEDAMKYIRKKRLHA